MGATLVALTACNSSNTASAPAGATTQQSAANSAPSGMHAVAITVDGNGFTPNHVELKVGAPAQLVFTRTSDATCATEVAFPELELKKSLPLNQPVTVDIPTSAARQLTFQCGMGMYKSAVVVR